MFAARFLSALKFIFSSSHGKLCLLLFQAILYLELFENEKKDSSFLQINLVQGFGPLKTEIARFPSWISSQGSGILPEKVNKKDKTFSYFLILKYDKNRPQSINRKLLTMLHESA